MGRSRVQLWDVYLSHHVPTNTIPGEQLRIIVGGGDRRASIRKVIQIASLNIWSGWAGGIKSVLRYLHQVNVGIGVLQEMKMVA